MKGDGLKALAITFAKKAGPEGKGMDMDSEDDSEDEEDKMDSSAMCVACCRKIISAVNSNDPKALNTALGDWMDSREA